MKFGRLRHWAMAGAVISGLAMRVLAIPGYLPAVGPANLRFLPEARPATNLAAIALPPPVEEPDSQPPPAEVAASPPAPSAPPAAPPPETNSPVSLSPLPPAAAPMTDPMISPQMLLKYFNRSTNGAAGGVIAPMEFAPPSSAKPPSSTATYSTSPN